MAKNERPSKGRVGEIKDRVQVFNPQNKRWIEINTKDNRIINVKHDLKPFKDVRKLKG